MIFSKLVQVGLAVFLISWLAPAPAKAESNLAELEGEWSGSGTDRDTPFGSMRKATCQSKIRADVRRMTNEIVCSVGSGIRKTFHLQILLDGSQVSGDVVQTLSVTGEKQKMRKGLILGRRTGDAAELQIKFGGLTPTANASFKVTNPSSYVLRVAALGAPLMDITFKRVGQARVDQVGQARVDQAGSAHVDQASR
jgi:hypothetical protein